jgi:hypothetical protein
MQEKISNGEGRWSASAMCFNSCVCIRANDGFVCGCDRGMNVRQKSVAAGLDVVVIVSVIVGTSRARTVRVVLKDCRGDKYL